MKKHVLEALNLNFREVKAGDIIVGEKFWLRLQPKRLPMPSRPWGRR
jgi:hypothetical protein